MSASLVEVVAKGPQDVYLTGKPDVSFFRQEYKHHTNFAAKPVELDAMGTIGPNTEIAIEILNKGDLLNYIWIDLGDKTLRDLGAGSTTQPTYFELWAGSQMIDRQDIFFVTQLWQKFLVDSAAKTVASMSSDETTNFQDHILDNHWLPLHFSIGESMYLPLVAIQHHKIELRIRFGSLLPVGTTMRFFANYILLDTAEREWFCKQRHTYLIEQVQKIPFEGNRFDLTLLNHPVKCLLWGHPSNKKFKSSDVQIYINGNDYFGSPMPDIYFTQVQGYYHSEHASQLLTGTPSSAGGNGSGGSNMKMFSFALKPSKHVPTGSINFSRIDTASMFIGTLNNAPAELNLYAINYNVLVIDKGLIGLQFGS